jgi:leucyl-tRNA synthetase
MNLLPSDRVLKDYISMQTLCISPIIPHFSEEIWTELNGRDSSIFNEHWPPTSVSDVLSKQKEMLDSVMKSGRTLANGTVSLILSVSSGIPQWQEAVFDALKEIYREDEQGFRVMEIKQLLSRLGTLPVKNNLVVPFVRKVHSSIIEQGTFHFDRPKFNQVEFLRSQSDYIRKSLGVDRIEVISSYNSFQVSVVKVEIEKFH